MGNDIIIAASTYANPVDWFDAYQIEDVLHSAGLLARQSRDPRPTTTIAFVAQIDDPSTESYRARLDKARRIIARHVADCAKRTPSTPMDRVAWALRTWAGYRWEV